LRSAAAPELLTKHGFDGLARPLWMPFNETERRLKIVADRCRESAPRLAEWTKANLLEGPNDFGLPEPPRRRLRTSNMLEHLNRELERQDRVVSPSPEEACAPRLASAFLADASDEWEAGRIYLTVESA
jgi:transposase-like protein